MPQFLVGAAKLVFECVFILFFLSIPIGIVASLFGVGGKADSRDHGRSSSYGTLYRRDRASQQLYERRVRDNNRR